MEYSKAFTPTLNTCLNRFDSKINLCVHVAYKIPECVTAKIQIGGKNEVHRLNTLALYSIRDCCVLAFELAEENGCLSLSHQGRCHINHFCTYKFSAVEMNNKLIGHAAEIGKNIEKIMKNLNLKVITQSDMYLVFDKSI